MESDQVIATKANIGISEVDGYVEAVCREMGFCVSREKIADIMKHLPYEGATPKKVGIALRYYQKLGGTLDGEVQGEHRIVEKNPDDAVISEVVTARQAEKIPQRGRFNFFKRKKDIRTEAVLPDNRGGGDLTEEQKRVVQHPVRKHARVLAVAGSGKTTTMAHRVKYLMKEKRISPGRIQVLMFNRLAKEQFIEKLVEVGIPEGRQPSVKTYHGYAYSVIMDRMSGRRIPKYEIWNQSMDERIKYEIRKILTALEKDSIIEEGDIDVDDALHAIGLWKASLIPTSRAGYTGNPSMRLVYSRFEELREDLRFITFDDYVPMAVEAMEQDDLSRGKFCGGKDFLIVDEYQDVNYGQERMIELIAGKRADVMVVGDDDQTIYEWRGARPYYILEGFKKTFRNKPVEDYTLSRTFRLPASIAQSASNSIQLNSQRLFKNVISHFPQKEGGLTQFCGPGKEISEASHEMAEEIIQLVKASKVPPKEIYALVRLYSQLSSLETALLARKVPYRVLGQSSFLHRREIRVLLNYVLVAYSMMNPIDKDIGERFLGIINKPMRMLGRMDLDKAVRGAAGRRKSLGALLDYLTDEDESPFIEIQRERVEDFRNLLLRIREKLEKKALPGPLFRWIVEQIGYMEHFQEYYGDGETAFERQNTVESFLKFADGEKKDPLSFIQWINELDTQRGLPEDKVITLTTIYKVKGLEFQHVFIPQCEEGFMPCMREDDGDVYDTEEIIPWMERSSRIDSERRLYYVGITRAKENVYLGFSGDRPGRSGATRVSRFIEESDIDVTQEVFSAFQKLITGKDSAGDKFFRLLENLSPGRRILEPLTSEYSKMVGGNGFGDQLRRHLRLQPGGDFTYSMDYDALHKKEKGHRNLNDWDDPWVEDLPF